MSLFDSIRYPVSDKPTEDELTAIPGELYLKWIMATPWIQYLDEPHTISPFYVADWYSYKGMGTSKEISEIYLLRQMILEL